MPKLPNRQVIIFGITAVMILYGAYHFVFSKTISGRTPVPAKNTVKLSALLTDAGSTAAAGAVELYLIKRAETAWTHNPFYEQRAYREWFFTQNPGKATEAKGSAKVIFNYTGYLELGKKKMAIINGAEYGVGDPLDVEGYLLKSISPASVLIENRTGKTKFTVPIQD